MRARRGRGAGSVLHFSFTTAVGNYRRFAPININIEKELGRLGIGHIAARFCFLVVFRRSSSRPMTDSVLWVVGGGCRLGRFRFFYSTLYSLSCYCVMMSYFVPVFAL